MQRRRDEVKYFSSQKDINDLKREEMYLNKDGENKVSKRREENKRKREREGEEEEGKGKGAASFLCFLSLLSVKSVNCKVGEVGTVVVVAAVVACFFPLLFLALYFFLSFSPPRGLRLFFFLFFASFERSERSGRAGVQSSECGRCRWRGLQKGPACVGR